MEHRPTLPACRLLLSIAVGMCIMFAALAYSGRGDDDTRVVQVVRTLTPTPSSMSDPYEVSLYAVQEGPRHDYADLYPAETSLEALPLPFRVDQPLSLTIAQEREISYEGHTRISLTVYSELMTCDATNLDQFIHLARSLVELDKHMYFEEFLIRFLAPGEWTGLTTDGYISGGRTSPSFGALYHLMRSSSSRTGSSSGPIETLTFTSFEPPPQNTTCVTSRALTIQHPQGIQ